MFAIYAIRVFAFWQLALKSEHNLLILAFNQFIYEYLNKKVRLFQRYDNEDQAQSRLISVFMRESAKQAHEHIDMCLFDA
jgi:hypothetical protein